LDIDVLQLFPLAVLRLSMILVPVTEVKLGILVLQILHEPPLSLEYLYSSVTVPVPPLPGVTVTVNAVPEHTSFVLGDFVSPGATGSATTRTVILSVPEQPLSSVTV
jgi:hypothetical protein